MKLALSSGVELSIEAMNAVLSEPATRITHDALIVPAALLVQADSTRALARKLVGSGCSLVAVLGPDAEKAHDSLDEALIDFSRHLQSTGGGLHGFSRPPGPA